MQRLCKPSAETSNVFGCFAEVQPIFAIKQPSLCKLSDDTFPIATQSLVETLRATSQNAI